MQPPAPSRLARATMVLVVLWAALAATNRVVSHDAWVDVRIGREILATGHVPTVDAWSGTALGKPYLAHEWLACVLFALLEKLGGFAALSVLCGLSGLAIALLMLFAIPRARRSEPLVLLAWMAALFLVEERLTARPHVLAHACEAGLVLLLARFRQEKRVRWLAFAPRLQILWVNLHASALLGPALLAAAAAGDAIDGAFIDRANLEARLRDARRLGVTALACLLACLVNPRGVELLAFASALSRADFLRSATHEWRSPLASLPSAPWTLPFALLLLGPLVSVALRIRRGGLAQLPQVALAVKLGLQAVRFLPELAILGLPVLVDGLPTRERRGLREVSLAGAAALVLLVLVRGEPETERWRPIGVGPGDNLALAEVDELGKRGLQGVIYCEIADGGPIILALGPRVRPVMDARLDLYGPQLFGEWSRAELDVDALLRYLDAHHVDLVMLDPTFHQATLERLSASPEWHLEFSNPRRFLLSRAKR
ncbi:MAG: hypothetical protein JST54_05950 [Deltaproteobacteria bacterium]|nr:hypothetical protein [Deltaproteobacteria bacterium]